MQLFTVPTRFQVLRLKGVYLPLQEINGLIAHTNQRINLNDGVCMLEPVRVMDYIRAPVCTDLTHSHGFGAVFIPLD